MMTVYVDEIVDYGAEVRKRLGSARWCHMTADTREELHETADALGLRRSWFQHPESDVMFHYDITPNKRAAAIRLGARPINATMMGALISARRAAVNIKKNREEEPGGALDPEEA